jgi:hypothetical protein
MATARRAIEPPARLARYDGGMKHAVLGVAIGMIAVAHVRAAQAGACAPPRPSERVLTPDGATIAGAIVIQADLQKMPAWTVRGGNPLVDAQLEPIGPSLYRVALPGTTDVELDDVHGAAVVHVKRGSLAPIAPAPAVKAITYHAEHTRRGRFVNVDVRFAAPPPHDAVAVLVSTVAGAKATQTSWGNVAEDGNGIDPAVLTVFRSGSCIAQPTGTGAYAPGDRVVVQWVDAAGRLSARSPVTAIVNLP